MQNYVFCLVGLAVTIGVGWMFFAKPGVISYKSHVKCQGSLLVGVPCHKYKGPQIMKLNTFGGAMAWILQDTIQEQKGTFLVRKLNEF